MPLQANNRAFQIYITTGIFNLSDDPHKLCNVRIHRYKLTVFVKHFH